MLSIFSCAVGHLHIFFGEMSIQILYSLLIGLSFLLLNYKAYLYSDFRSLSDIWFASLFSHFAGCLFTFLVLSSDAQKFNVDVV